MLRHYVDTVKSWINVPAKPGIKHSKQKNFPLVVAALKKLTVTAASVLQDRFDRTFEKVGKTSLVANMSMLRLKSFNGHHFIEMVKRVGDSTTNTDREKVKFLAYGSSVLRYIYHQIATYVLRPSESPNKLLLCKDVPLSAQF